MSRKLVDNTYIRTHEKGFRCHSNKALNKGDIVMECVIPAELVTKNTIMMRSCRWSWKDGVNDYEDDFIPLGNVLMVTHVAINFEPNIVWSVSKEQRIVTGRALKSIDKDEELMYDRESHMYIPEELS